MTSNVRLAWNPADIPDLKHYHVYRDGTLVGTPTSETFLDRNLPDGSYSYQISGVDTHGNEGTKSGAIVKTVPGDTTNPPGPSQPILVLEGSGIRVNWVIPAGAEPYSDIVRYEVLRKTDAGAFEFVGNTTSTTFLDRDLPGAHVYSYKVIAFDEDENEAQSLDSSTLTIDLPVAPTDIVLEERTGDVILTWETDEMNVRFLRFEIFKRVAPEVTYDLIGKTNTTRYIDPGVEPDNADYIIRKVHVLGETADSTLISSSFVTPPIPSDLRARLLSNDDAELYWDIDTDDKVRFELELNKDAAGWVKIAEITSQSYKYRRPIPYTSTYQYRVRAITSFDEPGAYSNTASLTPTAPATPGNTAVKTFFEGAGIRVSWTYTLPDEADHYLIYRKVDGGAYGIVGKAGSNNTYTDRNLPAGSTYFYKVSAVNSAGTEGTQSPEVSLELLVAPKPKILRFKKNSGNIELFWNVDTISPRFVGFQIRKIITGDVLNDPFDVDGTPSPNDWKVINGTPVNFSGTLVMTQRSASDIDKLETVNVFSEDTTVELRQSSLSSSASASETSIIAQIYINSQNYIILRCNGNGTHVKFQIIKDGATVHNVSIAATYTATHKWEIVWTATDIKLYIDTVLKSTGTHVLNGPASLKMFGPTIFPSSGQFDRIIITGDDTELAVGTPRQQSFIDRFVNTLDTEYFVATEHVLDEVSEEDDIDVSFPAPTTPTNVRSRLQTDGDIEVKWDDDTDEPLTYEVWLNINAAGWFKIDETTSQQYTYEVTIGGGATPYVFRLKSRDSFGIVSLFSTTTTQTPT